MFDFELFGKQIKYYRLKQGLTLAQLAEKAGIGDKYLSRIEHGYHNISTNFAVSILNALNIDFNTCLYNNDFDKILCSTCVEKFKTLSDYEKKFMIYFLKNQL